MSSYTLYGAFLSMPCVKIGLMLDLCGLKYDYKHVNLRAGENKTPEFLAMNKWGQVPVLVEDGAAMAQSGAILIHLAEKTGKLDGATPAEKHQVREWIFWDADLLHPGIAGPRSQILFLNGAPEIVAFGQARGQRALGMLETALEGRQYLVGDKPTIADLACFVTASYADDAKIALDPYPNVRAWLARIAAMPGLKTPQEALPRPAA